jgi:cell shape-determining protein MreC
MRYLIGSATLRTLLVYLFVAFVLLGADSYGLLRFFRSGLELIIIPIEKISYEFGKTLNYPIKVFTYWRSGTERIADLERQVAELMVDSARTNQLEEENLAMRDQLGANLPRSIKLIPAAILGKGDLVSISAGSNLGLASGDLVISKDILLGTIDEVSARKSTVRLLTDPKSKISIYSPRYGTEGIASGRFGSQLIASQVLQQERLVVEDNFLTSGSIGAPRGLLVGRIEKVTSNTNDVFQEAVLRQPLDISTLVTVFVLKQEEK